LGLVEHYAADTDEIAAYARAARSEAGFDAYVQRTAFGAQVAAE